MSGEDIAVLVTNVVTVLFVIFGVAAVVSGLYIVSIYRQRQEDAPFLTRLVHRDVRVATAAAVILGYIVLSLSGISLGRPWGAVIVGGAILVLVFGVIDDAVQWFLERRRYGNGPNARMDAMDRRMDQTDKYQVVQDQRMDRQEARTSGEIERTDGHQLVQDERITDLEP